MAEKTILIETDHANFDPAFLENLNHLAEKYDVRIKSKVEFDSVQMIRDDREFLDRRDEERAARGKGLRKDWSHLDRMKG